VGEHPADFGGREDVGEVAGAAGALELVEPGEPDAEHLAVEEEEGGERQVLGGGRDAALRGQVREERGDLVAAEPRGWRRPWKWINLLIQET